MNIIQVLRCIKTSQWGGTESVVLELSKSLQKNENQVQIYTSPLPNNRDRTMIDQISIKKLLPIFPYCLQKNLQIIHWHQGLKIAKVVRKMADFYRVPYFATLHGSTDSLRAYLDDSLNPNNYFKPEDKIFYEQAEALFCVGQEEHEVAQQVFPNNRVLLTPNGVDMDRFRNGNGKRIREELAIPNDARVLLCVARIDEKKNQMLLVEALSELRKTDQSIYLLLAGRTTAPEYEEKLLDRIDELSLQPYVKQLKDFNPLSSTIADIYDAADIFVLPSFEESFGIVILEAWASQKSVIASKVGGIPFFVEHEKDALLFESDHLSDLLKQINCLLYNSEYAQTLAEAGKKKAESQYNWCRISSIVEDTYRKSLESRGVVV